MGKVCVQSEHGICDYRRQWTFDNFLRRLIHPYNKVLGPHVRPGMKTADIGCGTGYNTMGLARLVGRGGGVLAVDVQQGALAKVEKRAARQGLESVVSIMHVDAVEHRELPSIDFALAFWMVHEVPDCRAFFRWVFEALVPGGRLLVAEPPMHITQKVLQEEVSAAGKAGFQLVGSPRIRFCKTMLFEKPE